MNKYRDTKTGRYVHSPANRTKQLINELYRAFDRFNQQFAEGKLPEVVITIQNKGRANALGWFGDNFWKDRLTNNTVGEINLSAEHISRGKHACMETLLHEMAHLWNAAVLKIKDCSGSQYHNKRFKTAAERFGLSVERDGSRGWAFTSLNEPAKQAIDNINIDETLFTGLRRRQFTRSEKKYVSLVVDLDSVDIISSIKDRLGLSQKQVVQQAISHYYTHLIN